MALSRARQLRLEGELAFAACLTEAVLVLEPRNADAWLELGLARASLGQGSPASAAFLRALEIAPDYDDARLGLARLAYRSGDLEAARQWLAGISPARSSDAEVATLQRSLAAPRPGEGNWRVDAFAAYSDLSGDQAPWREASFSAQRRDGDNSWGLGVEVAERFARSDAYGEIRAAQLIGSATWGVALGGARDPNFKPEAALRFELSMPVGEDWFMEAALSAARYSVGEVDRLSFRAGRNFTRAFRLSGQGIVVHDEMDELRTGYSLGAAWGGEESTQIFLAWTDAPESSEGVTIDVRAVSVGMAVAVSADMRVRVTALREERDSFDRNELSLAVTRIF